MEIWIPSSARAAFKCRVPTDADGGVCGKPFMAHEQAAFTRHVVKCAREHEQQIHDSKMTTKLPFMQPWDPEFAEYTQRTGKV